MPQHPNTRKANLKATTRPVPPVTVVPSTITYCPCGSGEEGQLVTAGEKSLVVCSDCHPVKPRTRVTTGAPVVNTTNPTHTLENGAGWVLVYEIEGPDCVQVHRFYRDVAERGFITDKATARAHYRNAQRQGFMPPA